jgi:hypothetical protein
LEFYLDLPASMYCRTRIDARRAPSPTFGVSIACALRPVSHEPPLTIAGRFGRSSATFGRRPCSWMSAVLAGVLFRPRNRPAAHPTGRLHKPAARRNASRCTRRLDRRAKQRRPVGCRGRVGRRRANKLIALSTNQRFTDKVAVWHFLRMISERLSTRSLPNSRSPASALRLSLWEGPPLCCCLVRANRRRM